MKKEVKKIFWMLKLQEFVYAIITIPCLYLFNILSRYVFNYLLWSEREYWQERDCFIDYAVSYIVTLMCVVIFIVAIGLIGVFIEANQKKAEKLYKLKKSRKKEDKQKAVIKIFKWVVWK
jgi:hypothetical protein